jgi:hypothetical protein
MQVVLVTLAISCLIIAAVVRAFSMVMISRGAKSGTRFETFSRLSSNIFRSFSDWEDELGPGAKRWVELYRAAYGFGFFEVIALFATMIFTRVWN